MRRYETVIFDLDGTLLDTLEDLTDAVNHALGAYNIPLRTIEEIRGFVGNGVRNLMLQAVPNGEKNPSFEEIFAVIENDTSVLIICRSVQAASDLRNQLLRYI